MGCCCSCQSSTTAGSQLHLPEVPWDGGSSDGISMGVEVGGIPLTHFLSQFSGLGPDERQEVAANVVADLHPISSPSLGMPRSGILRKQPVRLGVFTWNVGGISDNRKEAGAGIHESSRGDVMKVLAAFVERLGAVDIIVVGLQETISLTAQNAMKGMSSVGDSRLKTQFYSWPATVAQWVEILLGGLNANRRTRAINPDAGENDDECSYALYGQPVYLFGMLLCVFCRTEILKHIKDFGMVEKALDGTWKSGAKGVVACRFVLFDRSFCFINCHLTAQKTNSSKYSLKSFNQRLLQLQRIWAEVKFKSQVDQMVYPVSAHRAVFLLGDTNFRISSVINSRLSRLHRNPKDPSDLIKKLASSDFSEEAFSDLWVHDQLYQELHRHVGRSTLMSGSAVGSQASMGHSGTLHSLGCSSSASGHPGSVATSGGTASITAQSSMGTAGTYLEMRGSTTSSTDGGPKALMLWREPVVPGTGPPFQPTFKLDVPGPGYSKKRAPAWTDRVLFRSQHVTPLAYTSVKQAEVLKPPQNISDHDPVYARFEVECVRVQSSKLAQLIREVKRRGSGSPSSAGGRRVVEQALSFRANIVEAAQPEIEDFARRIFAGLQDVLGPDEALGGAAQLLECQEDCWHLVCNHYESLIRDSIRRASNESGGEVDASVMNRAIQKLLEELQGNQRSRSVYVV